MPPVLRPTSFVRAHLESLFPNLQRSSWNVRSPQDDDYQCIAWAACRTDRHMWPNQDYWWFPGLPVVVVPEEAPVEYLVQGFRLLGYKPCESSVFEVGYQKVAIYANDIGATHMARQHVLGRGWLSKIGTLEDIFHRELSDLEGNTSPLSLGYGRVALVLKRSWWAAARCGLFRGWWAALKFWIYRLANP